MARKRREDVEEVEELEDDDLEEEIEDEGDEEKPKSRRGPQPPRMSISITPRLRRKIRLAAALQDMEDGEWCKVVLATQAKRTVEKIMGS